MLIIEILYISIASLIILIGIAGTIIPIIPGPILSWVGLLLLQLFHKSFSISFMLITLILVIAISIIDYVMPLYIVKKTNSKSALIGCTIGVIIGLFFIPIGVIICPIIFTFIFEFFSSYNFKNSIKISFKIFISFILGTLGKLAISILLSFFFFYEVFSIYFS